MRHDRPVRSTGRERPTTRRRTRAARAAGARDGAGAAAGRGWVDRAVPAAGAGAVPPAGRSRRSCVAIYTSLFKWNGFGGLPTELRRAGQLHPAVRRRGLPRRPAARPGPDRAVAGRPAAARARPGDAAQPALRGRALYRLLFFAPVRALRGDHRRPVHDGPLAQTGAWRTTSSARSGWTTWRDLARRPVDGHVSLFLVMTWKYFGFHMILYLAGRQGIPEELTEAAAIDGASGWQAFRHVTLPLLGPTIRISVFLSVIGAIQLFDLVWVLTGGGPDPRLRDHGRDHVPVRLQALPGRLRQRDQRGDVPASASSSRWSTSASSCAATPRARSPSCEASDDRTSAARRRPAGGRARGSDPRCCT